MMIASGELLLRTLAVFSDKPPLISCASVISFDLYFQLLGRLLVAAQTNVALNTITVAAIGVQALLLRVTQLPVHKWFRAQVRLVFSATRRVALCGVCAGHRVDTVASCFY